MEFIGWVCFIIIIYYASYPGRVRTLERKISRLENKLKGDVSMSKLISELVGSRCKITNEDGDQTAWIYTILDADDEWIKVTYTNKKGIQKTEILRIDCVKKVDVIPE